MSKKNNKQNRLKFILTTCFIILINIQISAQKEQACLDSTAFKANSFKGIELKIECPYLASYLSLNGTGVPLFFNYMSERVLNSSSTIIFKAGINLTAGIFLEDTTFNTEFNPNLETGHKVPYCLFGFNLGVEPRWYWNYEKRAKEGKAKLNSGWFLSSPIEVNFPRRVLIHGPTIRPRTLGWITHEVIILYSIGISTGYRFALSEKLYLENSLEIQAVGDWTKYGDFDRWWPIQFVPQLEIRLGYTFKK